MDINFKTYQRCTRCVMDTTDPDIHFDSTGECSHCHDFDNYYTKGWKQGKEGETELSQLVKQIKENSRNKPYDCLLGLSGGVDSSYLAYIAKNLELRVLAIHVDAGWNSELAVQNIEQICSKLSIDLITEVVDWNEMKDLQRAFLKSRVLNLDIPQDHAYFAILNKCAVKYKIKYVLSGFNISSECILPPAWRGYLALDSVHLKAIHNKYGSIKLKRFPLMHFLASLIYYPYIRKIKTIFPLNYLSYNKEESAIFLQKELSWVPYGGKHHESRFTKFYQSYYLFKKFGIDERKAHYSSLILSGQLSRSEAIAKLSIDPAGDALVQKRDKAYICQKLGFTTDELEEILDKENGRHDDYKSSQAFVIKMLPHLVKFKNILRKLGLVKY